MTITVQYKSPSKGVRRYVAKRPWGNRYTYCIVGESGLDVEQGFCDAEDLPDDIRAACDADRPSMFYACEWPLEDYMAVNLPASALVAVVDLDGSPIPKPHCPLAILEGQDVRFGAHLFDMEGREFEVIGAYHGQPSYQMNLRQVLPSTGYVQRLWATDTHFEGRQVVFWCLDDAMKAGKAYFAERDRMNFLLNYKNRHK